MPGFLIEVREIHVSTIRIEAETAEDALRAFIEGWDSGEEVSCEYSHTVDPQDFVARPE